MKKHALNYVMLYKHNIPLREKKITRKISELFFSFLLVIYRSSDYSWNDHSNPSNQPLRVGSPIKNKVTSARHLTNGIMHESTAATTGNSMIHIPISSPPQQQQQQQQQHSRDDMNNGDLLLSSTGKSRQTSRLQRTNSHLDKIPGTATGYGLPMRSESYRSSRLDYGIRPRHTSSKQRNYVNSKTSFQDGDFYISGAQDENIYYHHQQQQQQINLLSSTQRLNGSAFDLTASRKPFSSNRSSTFNAPASGTGQHGYYSSTQELHRSDSNIDRNQFGRFVIRGTTSKEQIVSTPKQRHTSNVQTTTTTAVTANTPGERHPSAHSYKSRDPNNSYAYTDVKKYIEENDLMSPEKEQFIRNWILDVEKHRHQLQKIE